MKSNQDLSGEVLIAIRRVIRAVDLHSKKLSQEYNLTGPQALVLKEISVTKDITPGELAKRVSLSQATITDIVKRLESRDCVRRIRGMDDRRKVVLEITSAGIKLIDTAPPLLQEKFTQRFNQLADWEQTLLLSSLQHVASLMDADSLDAAPLLTSGAP
jgi:DNA-binding MarR family transcriptional regulator